MLRRGKFPTEAVMMLRQMPRQLPSHEVGRCYLCGGAIYSHQSRRYDAFGRSHALCYARRWLSR